MSKYHIPVMLEEVIKLLAVKKDQWYIDCNLGGGGHTEAILQAGGKVLGIDLDPDSISEVAKNHNLKTKSNDHLQAVSERLILYQINFSKLKDVVDLLKIGPVQGILFDLGVSSYQLESPERGFSFNQPAPLDMRMDQKRQNVSASDLVNALYENELTELFSRYGEERFAKPIARKIIKFRESKKIETTDQLAKIILSVRPRGKNDRTHPATRVFQALRIAVNDELGSLMEALPQTVEVLSPGGRLAVISFHSLEDKIVKDFLKDQENKRVLKSITRKPITPQEDEIDLNPRSRSGKLRVAEKL